MQARVFWGFLQEVSCGLHLTRMLGGACSCLICRRRALNYLPEGPSDAMRQNKAGTRRYRLVRLVCPVLRLVLSLLGGAPGSAKMVSEALEFCRGQHKLLGRLLKEAAAPGMRLPACSSDSCL